MCKVLMPIKPKYVDGIIRGSKKFEFRKIKTKRKIDSIVIYETSPVMKIVAEVMVKDIWIDHPAEIWKHTHQFAGIDKAEYDKYYENIENAVVYVLGEVEVFDQPKELIDYGLSFYPQSYVYLD